MIRIPLGKLPKDTTRIVTFLLGVASLITSLFLPQYSEPVREVGLLLSGLGLTLGKVDGS